ncbi:hypothetical protein JCM10207_003372 [Rhodosporidiobolus poonsookiae]
MDLFSFDSLTLAQWLPGVDKWDQTPDTSPARPSRSSWRPSTRPHSARSAEEEGVAPHANLAQRSAHSSRDSSDAMAKKNGRRRTKGSGKNASAKPGTAAAPAPSSKAGSTAANDNSSASNLVARPPSAPIQNGTAYPSAFFNDDLSLTPLYPSPMKEDAVELPPVQPVDAAFSPSRSSSRSYGQPIATDSGDDFYGYATRRTTSAVASDVTSSDFSSSDYDYSGEEYDDGYLSAGDADIENASDFADEDDGEDGRAFPSPRHAMQQRYFRRLDSDASDDSPVPFSTLDAINAKKGEGKSSATSVTAKLVSAPSWADPSLLPPPAPLAPAILSPQPVYAAPPPLSVSSLKPSLAGLNQYYALPTPPSSSSASSPSRSGATKSEPAPRAHPDAEKGDVYPRGRNPHPRLLWRSKMDRDTLAALDAHHDRLVGGPLPRLVVDAQEGAKLGASGVERERDHPGVREGGERGRSREERGRRKRRRAWSVEGRRWSLEVERCGL